MQKRRFRVGERWKNRTLVLKNGTGAGLKFYTSAQGRAGIFLGTKMPKLVCEKYTTYVQ